MKETTIDDLISPIAETMEDKFSGNFCTCYHLLSEHFGKCYALEFNGTVWSACRCTQVVPMQFEIKAEIYVNT